MRFAVARGLIDVHRLNRRNPMSRLYERERLRIAERAMMTELLSVLHTRYAAAVGFTPVGDPKGEQAVGMFDESGDLYRGIGRLLAPHMDWEETDPDTLDAKKAKTERSLWEQHFGSMDDPEVQRQLREYNAYVLRSRGVEVFDGDQEPADDPSGKWLQNQ